MKALGLFLCLGVLGDPLRRVYQIARHDHLPELPAVGSGVRGRVRQRILFDNAKTVVTERVGSVVQFNHGGDACWMHDPESKGKVESSIKYLRRNFLLVELGLLSLDKTASHQAYERQSFIVTSNRPFQECAGLFHDPVIVSTILDRLMITPTCST